MMDIEMLAKKISSFRGEGGRVRINDLDLYMEILGTWESWKGPWKDFCRTLGISHKGMSAIIGKAKKMRREGYVAPESFKEIQLPDGTTTVALPGAAGGIELAIEGGRVIRFSFVDQLVDFLKKAA